MRTLLLLVLCCGLVLAALPAAAAASPAGSCSVKQARRDVRGAERKLAEARRVLAATRDYTQAFGADVGRWVRLSRSAGWTWGDMASLMPILARESNGQPRALNPSGAAGLLQEMPCWYDGRWHYDPFVPRLNLAFGHRILLVSGWSAWSL